MVLSRNIAKCYLSHLSARLLIKLSNRNQITMRIISLGFICTYEQNIRWRKIDQRYINVNKNLYHLLLAFTSTHLKSNIWWSQRLNRGNTSIKYGSTNLCSSHHFPSESILFAQSNDEEKVEGCRERRIRAAAATAATSVSNRYKILISFILHFIFLFDSFMACNIIPCWSCVCVFTLNSEMCTGGGWHSRWAPWTMAICLYQCISTMPRWPLFPNYFFFFNRCIM